MADIEKEIRDMGMITLESTLKGFHTTIPGIEGVG